MLDNHRYKHDLQLAIKFELVHEIQKQTLKNLKVSCKPFLKKIIHSSSKIFHCLVQLITSRQDMNKSHSNGNLRENDSLGKLYAERWQQRFRAAGKIQTFIFQPQRIAAVATVFLWFWPCFIQLHLSVLRPAGPFCGFLMEH